MLTIYNVTSQRDSKSCFQNLRVVCAQMTKLRAALAPRRAARASLSLREGIQKRGGVEKLEVAAHTHYSLARTHPES